jgi:branched-chain amino acid transport system substrate-binding protein
MPFRRFVTVTLSCVFIVAVQAAAATAKPVPSCIDPAGCVVIGPGEPVRLGSLVVGELVALGRESAQAVELATEARGDLAGHPIRLIHLGDGCNPGLATTTAEAVAADGLLVAVLGASCSSASIPVAPILGGAGIATISPSSTNALLTDPDLRDPFFFRFAYNDQYAGDELAAFLIGQGLSDAATVVADHPSLLATGQRFADEFVQAGGTLSNELVVGNGQDDFSVELAAIASDVPDVIVFLTFQGAAFVTQARDTLGIETTPLASTEAAQGLVAELADPADAEGLVLSLPDFSFLEEEPYLSTLGAPFIAAFGEPTLAFHAYAFDAANRLMDVVESFQQGNSQKLTVPRTALRDAIAATTNYPGVTGLISCDPNGDCNGQEFVIRVVVGGVLVEPS